MTFGGFHSFKIRPHFSFLFFKFGRGWSHVAATGSWFALLSQRFSALLSSHPAVFFPVEVPIFCNHITSQSLKNLTQRILWASHCKVAFWIIFIVLLHPLYSFLPSTSECRQKYWAVLQMQHLLSAPCCIVFPSSAFWHVFPSSASRHIPGLPGSMAGQQRCAAADLTEAVGCVSQVLCPYVFQFWLKSDSR